MNSIWRFFTSLRLTVTCLSFGIVLVFLGTIAQVNEGLWQAQERWFKSFFIWWGPAGAEWTIPIMPGGYLVGIVLVLNLLAAHIKRFQFTLKKVGINLTHLGIILLLVGQLATDLLSNESLISFREGEARQFTESHRGHELVFLTDADVPGQERVISIPEEMVREGREITHERLPFTVRVQTYYPNSEVFSHDAIASAGKQLTAAIATVTAQFATADGLVPQAERAQSSEGRASVWREALKAIGESETGDLVAAARRVAAQQDREGRLRDELKTRFQNEMLARFKMQGGATRLAAMRFAKNEALTPEAFPPAAQNGAGHRVVCLPLPETKEMDRNNLPSAVLELKRDGKSLGTWLVSPWLNDENLDLDGGKWRTAFRSERTYLPYSMQLMKTTHEVYRGTDIPKNFQSRVRLQNSNTGENREVDIYMNNPLRYEGLTFYQYQMGRDEQAAVGTSTLQVVRNPSYLTPYIGCAIVAVGMIWQFMYHLVGFISKRRTA